MEITSKVIDLLDPGGYNEVYAHLLEKALRKSISQKRAAKLLEKAEEWYSWETERKLQWLY